jgi:hypothetical protein
MPGWLVTIVVALGLSGLGAAAYYYVLPSVRAHREAAAAGLQFEKPGPAGSAASSENRLAKFIEVTGLRVTEDAKQKTQATFIIVNHSAADIANLSGDVFLRPKEAAPNSPALTSFRFKVASLGPYQSKEITAHVKTQLRAYELPDWNLVRADFQLTSP